MMIICFKKKIPTYLPTLFFLSHVTPNTCIIFFWPDGKFSNTEVGSSLSIKLYGFLISHLSYLSWVATLHCDPSLFLNLHLMSQLSLGEQTDKLMGE